MSTEHWYMNFLYGNMKVLLILKCEIRMDSSVFIFCLNDESRPSISHHCMILKKCPQKYGNSIKKSMFEKLDWKVIELTMSIGIRD